MYILESFVRTSGGQDNVVSSAQLRPNHLDNMLHLFALVLLATSSVGQIWNFKPDNTNWVVEKFLTPCGDMSSGTDLPIE